MTSGTLPTLDSWLALAGAGYHLIPVTLRTRPDGKKDVRFHVDWQHEAAATTDPDQIKAWWVDNPDVSFAIDCGRTGVVVVDLDVADDRDGMTWWAEQGHPISTMRGETRSGGLHLYFRADPDRPLRNTAGTIAPGVDTRAVGGCVFAPGSTVLDAGAVVGRYALLDPLLPVAELPPAPEVLYEDPAASRKRAWASDGRIVTHDRDWMRQKADEQRERVRGWTRGDGLGFRYTLMGAAMFCARLVEAGLSTVELVTAALIEDVAAVWGAPDEDDRMWIEAGLADGPRKERWRVVSTIDLGGPHNPQNPDEWPAPTLLPTLPPLVEFPADALPDWVRDWVRAEAEATQTPEDLAGTCALCVLAACAGGRAEVEARSGWREPTNLYGLPVMAPGSRKSAVVAAATRPLYAAEEDLAAAVRGAQAEALVTRDIAQKAAKAAMEKAAKVSADKRADATSEAISAQSAAEGIEVPVTPRLLADDVTPEAVGSLLAAHGGRLAIISAEGGVFDTMNGKYSNGVPSLDVWLKGHSGDVLRVDRKGRDPEYIRRPALTLLLTVQPTVLAAVAHNPAFRGRGLVARFLPALPLDNVGRRRIGAPPVPPDVTATYEKRVAELVAELAGWTDPAVLTLTPEAHELLLQLERNVEPRLAPDGEYGTVREWASKLVGAILRIAALLHLAEDGGRRTRTPIEADTLRRASTLGDYFASHAMRAFGALTAHDRDHAAELLDWLRKRPRKPQNPAGDGRGAGSVGYVVLSVRDAHYALKRRAWVQSADDIRAAFDVLADHGWVRPVEREPGKPGRPSERYELHPAITSDGATTTEPTEATRPARPLTEEQA